MTVMCGTLFDIDEKIKGNIPLHDVFDHFVENNLISKIILQITFIHHMYVWHNEKCWFLILVIYLMMSAP